MDFAWILDGVCIDFGLIINDFGGILDGFCLDFACILD